MLVNKNSKLVLFDIDGTLIRGHYPASVGRFGYIFKKYLGFEAKINWNNLDGTTDKVIYRKVLRDNGLNEKEIDQKLEQIFEDAYDYLAKRIKNDYCERLIKEAAALVKELSDKGINIGLLTGNDHRVAKLKIKTVGLNNYFKFGLYGNQADNRNQLAKLVFKKAKEVFGIDFKSANIYIIGDTPNDVFCGKFINAKTIAVATGAYSLEDLKKTKPDLIVKNLADKKVLKFILS